MNSDRQEFDVFMRALRFASQKHRDQRRKGVEKAPYINHPIDVAELLWRVGGVRDMALLAAALLHDTVEDTSATADEIAGEFGSEVMDLVMEVTDDKTIPSSDRKQLQVDHASDKSTRAKLLKLADKTCNVRDISESPPANWDAYRLKEYLNWSEAVVAGLRGVNPALEQHYDEVLRSSRLELDKGNS